MKSAFLIGLLTIAAVTAPGQTAVAPSTNAAPLIKISAGEATNYYNKTVIVTGKVAQVTVRPGIVFLNIDKPYPDSPFTAVIFPAATNQFGAVTNLKGKSVEIKGAIKEYHGKPEVVLDSSNQLTVCGNGTPKNTP